jgi:hypothetical protein
LWSYTEWLSQSFTRNNSLDCARYWIRQDPILRDESATLQDNIATALQDLAS